MRILIFSYLVFIGLLYRTDFQDDIKANVMYNSQSTVYIQTADTSIEYKSNYNGLEISHLYRRIRVPAALTTTKTHSGQILRFGGDLRIGDLTNNGQVDFLIYRSIGNMHDEGGYKPNFLGAFDIEGNILWQLGKKGYGLQPGRPGAVAIHDLDADGSSEVICLFVNSSETKYSQSFQDVELLILDGVTGKVERRSAPSELRKLSGSGRQWAHQRILIANLRGNTTPQDFIIKLGNTVLAFDDHLEVLWTYKMPPNFDDPESGNIVSYIPTVGDMEGDGRDEVFGGYYLLDHDGQVMWENILGPNMDSVVMAPWDDNKVRAIGSGGGFILDEQGDVILEIGVDNVPHGQEIRTGLFDPSVPAPQLLIRYEGHSPRLMLVDNEGEIVRRFNIHESPNNTGLELVYWNGYEQPLAFHNGNYIYNGRGQVLEKLPLPEPKGPFRQSWYHSIPVDIIDNGREELIVWDPYSNSIYIFCATQVMSGEQLKEYIPTPRQYNPRLMD